MYDNLIKVAAKREQEKRKKNVAGYGAGGVLLGGVSYPFAKHLRSEDSYRKMIDQIKDPKTKKEALKELVSNRKNINTARRALNVAGIGGMVGATGLGYKAYKNYKSNQEMDKVSSPQHYNKYRSEKDRVKLYKKHVDKRAKRGKADRTGRALIGGVLGAGVGGILGLPHGNTAAVGGMIGGGLIGAGSGYLGGVMYDANTDRYKNIKRKGSYAKAHKERFADYHQNKDRRQRYREESRHQELRRDIRNMNSRPLSPRYRSIVIRHH
tara:strand:- start:2493 stop:3293 length:801 start_codon:yes stop_codon:yes gene_type:complete